jgi:hypothetical protein
MKVGLHLADGVPTVFSTDHPERPTFFPLRGPRVWTLEFVAASHPPRLSHDDEARMVEDLERAYRAETPERQ